MTEKKPSRGNKFAKTSEKSKPFVKKKPSDIGFSQKKKTEKKGYFTQNEDKPTRSRKTVSDIGFSQKAKVKPKTTRVNDGKTDSPNKKVSDIGFSQKRKVEKKGYFTQTEKKTGFKKSFEEKLSGERPFERRKSSESSENTSSKFVKKIKKTDENDDESGRKNNTFSNYKSQRSDDEKPAYKKDKPVFGDKKPYVSKSEFGKDKPGYRKDKPAFGDKKPYGNKTEFGKDKPSYRKDKPTFGDKKPYGKEKTSYENKTEFGKDKPAYKKDKPVFGDKKPYVSKTEFGKEKPGYRKDKPSFGDKKPYSKDKPSFGDKKSTYGKDKPAFKKEPFNFENKTGSFNDKSQKMPEYNLEKYAKRLPKKKQLEQQGDGTIRLNRYISNAGVCSRRDADMLIEAGEIKVNGKTITEFGYKVNPTDIVKYGNRTLNREKMVYLLLNKPKDFITTVDDPEERKTVMDLVKNACPQRIYPVGRLDRNTTGLLLFTNDGELAEKLTHPSNEIKKLYQVEIDKPIMKDHFDDIVAGFELEDGFIQVDEIATVSSDKTLLGVQIHSGKNRIVRRIFEHLGYDVVGLDRVMYAGLTKKDLPRGNWRFLSEKEVIHIKYLL